MGRTGDTRRWAPFSVRRWPRSPKADTASAVEYDGGMRVKTSVTLSTALLEQIDRLEGNRSAFLERAALAYLARRAKTERDAQDAAILDRVANELNQQSDVLEFQGFPE